jgi:hypothetical protein
LERIAIKVLVPTETIFNDLQPLGRLSEERLKRWPELRSKLLIAHGNFFSWLSSEVLLLDEFPSSRLTKKPKLQIVDVGLRMRANLPACHFQKNLLPDGFLSLKNGTKSIWEPASGVCALNPLCFGGTTILNRHVPSIKERLLTFSEW